METLNRHIPCDITPLINPEEVLAMGAKRRVTVSWNGQKQRWGVVYYWEGYKNPFRKYSWELPSGEVISFTKEKKDYAEEYAKYIRSLMTPDQRTGVCRFDPTKLSKQKKSKYSLSRYRETFILDSDDRLRPNQ